MEIKMRYKMRKVKKKWVTIALTSVAGFALVGGLTSTVQAEDVTTETSSQVTTSSESSTSETSLASETSQATSQAELNQEVSLTSEETSTTAVDTSSQEEELETTTETAVAAIAPSIAYATTEESTTNTTIVDPTTEEINSALSSQANIKLVDGKYYYYDESGNIIKNITITVNGVSLYFDAETGAYTDTTYSYSDYNQAYDNTAESFETVDNYLTADSWYRPKYILQNGTTWTASTENDFRPILMSWWPDTATQVNYVNYMNKELGISGSVTTSSTSQALTTATQAIQAKIEQKITAQASTEWLRETMKSFVATQSQWNQSSEYRTTEHLQGGAFEYVNSDKTPWANSDYRLISRTPTNQTGTRKYFTDNSIGGSEYLLANDVDNSNPIVQAEQLNQLYYLMNFGSIFANDPDANFDGVRIDAVDNVDADLLQIAADLYQAMYGTDESDAKNNEHLSILEAWSHNDPQYTKDNGGEHLNMDDSFRISLLNTLTRSSRYSLSYLIKSELVDRSNNSTYNTSQANYSFVRAHDSEVQTIIAKIISSEINSATDGYTFTLDELSKAFEIYNADMNSASKKYTHYNIPAAYALLLSNKDTVPRVYYGDLYTDNGQFMETKSPYYNAIDTLLQARIRYASGGQSMKVTNVASTTYNKTYEVLTSVRYGQDIMSSTDTTGTALSKTSGMVTIIANDPNIQMSSRTSLQVNVGKVHAGQAYRPLLLSTSTGIATYLNDSDTKTVKYVDSNGNLTFTSADIKGYSTAQVSGYLAVWVPVGASADQDIRVEASTTKINDGQQYHSNTALDSHLIFEGFSNFQDFVKTDDQYTNKVIAQNVDQYVKWGITDFEMAPQYVSSTDGTFLDSIIQNGYAFTDRYDLGISQNNKYGSAQDLVGALKALHSVGIKVLVDWVPDQIYSLPGEEAVAVKRVNIYGDYLSASGINGQVYVANTKSSGSDLQSVYGGAFLDELQAKYPEIFNVKQISTGKTIDPSTKITQWSAKYFNGTNILGRGIGYVLSDAAGYLNLTAGSINLPTALFSSGTISGFSYDGKGYTYKLASGKTASNQFITVSGDSYYFDGQGHMVTGLTTINGTVYYFLPNGKQLKNGVYTDENGNAYYFDENGKQVTGTGYKQIGNSWRYFNNGIMATGLTNVNGDIQYFTAEGKQVKGDFATDASGQKRYYDADSGNQVSNKFVMDTAGNWYYVDAQGNILTGLQTINGQKLYFDNTGKQVKGQVVTIDGSQYYFDADSGEMAISRFAPDSNGNWYYFGTDGKAVTGLQTINGQKLYFDNTGKQVKGQLITDASGNIRYFDKDSGEMLVSQTLKIGNTNYNFDANGAGTAQLVRDGFVTEDGSLYYYVNKAAVKNKYVQNTETGKWFYFGSDGKAVTGFQTINGVKQYFYADGSQAKNEFVTINGSVYYFDNNWAQMATSQYIQNTSTGKWYYFGSDGKAVIGLQTINNIRQYFYADGTQAKGELVTINGKLYYFEASWGQMVRNTYININGHRLRIDYNGVATYIY
ncbi:glycoside hydrolase family 70 protein [Streptococcus loxodontisalivarius]|uniref:dextransucrase n=1 Tax=Streptococcus loxodontisalivarius TaxID=1349415 RepID=A0ABS2PPM7_9STRE|nr:glycoside hydrolase family 70 protein [Streptococcus loxodontisalivarius]MBM7641982.1 dextransucrase [Streptococcus loxodontisalivarius]